MSGEPGAVSYLTQQIALPIIFSTPMTKSWLSSLSGTLLVASLLTVGCGGGKAANRIAVLETSMGTIKFELYEDKAPITTANFIKLAESGFYDGLIFHRVIDNFVIQTGDPLGDGTGGSDETIKLEIRKDLTHKDGAVGMARSSNPDSASSQFYICDGAQHGLDGNYAVFGQVIEGMDVVRAVAAVATGANDKPLQDVVMTKVTIQST
jgi:cyclophilin family peptidyl-prolyl cis-trans isomerase